MIHLVLKHYVPQHLAGTAAWTTEIIGAYNSERVAKARADHEGKKPVPHYTYANDYALFKVTSLEVEAAWTDGSHYCFPDRT